AVQPTDAIDVTSSFVKPPNTSFNFCQNKHKYDEIRINAAKKTEPPQDDYNGAAYKAARQHPLKTVCRQQSGLKHRCGAQQAIEATPSERCLNRIKTQHADS
ncbi:hypothetical protein, partial [Bordetella avium]|uniref:hypothetical protein n=1 Tax=Bordetella avium TaxID=521 RepID=UPI00307D86E7